MALPLDHDSGPATLDTDLRQIRQDLTVIIAGLQTTIEITNEDDTRQRSREILKRCQLLAKRLDLRFEAERA